MKKILKRLATGFLAFATIVTALPTTAVHASEKQYWTESAERVGIVEKVMNDGSIGSTFNEGHMTVEGEDAFCVDINTNFRNGYKTRADASTRMSYDQISDVALSIEYVNQYVQSHSGLSTQHIYLLKQCVVWQRLSVHLGWQCDNVRASYDEIPKAIQDEVYAGAKAFASENKGRYECGGYIYSGEGQELGQFWAKLNVGNATLQKTSSNTGITDGNENYSIAGATYGVFADKDCTKQLATLTTDKNGNTDGIKDQYDAVIIDCMPSLGMITINALAASDEVLIPVEASYLPIKGLQQLLKTIGKVRKQINPKLQVGGILFTMVDAHTNDARNNMELLRNVYGSQIHIFDNYIPFSVRMKEAVREGQSIFSYDPKGKATEAYRRVTEEVLEDAI